MFTKLAILADGRRRHRAAPASAHSYAPRRVQPRAVTPRRTGRYVLVCRWFSIPTTGKLECRWQIEPVAEAPAEAPGTKTGERRRASRVGRPLAAASGLARGAPRAATLPRRRAA